MITSDARYKREMKSRISTAKAALDKTKALSSTKLILILGNKPVKYYS
jgi:hypothetical protein